jgi:hypothetical protein
MNRFRFADRHSETSPIFDRHHLGTMKTRAQFFAPLLRLTTSGKLRHLPVGVRRSVFTDTLRAIDADLTASTPLQNTVFG